MTKLGILARLDLARDWMTAPVYVPRWALIAKYFLFGIVGLIVYNYGSKTLESANPQYYVTAWAASMAAVGFIAFAGQLSRRLEWLELFGAGAISTLTLVMIFFSFTQGSALFGAYLLLAVTLPISRTEFLTRRLWRQLVARRISKVLQ